jgi:hypothetical protein
MWSYDIEQVQVDGAYYYTKLNSQTDVDSQLCDNTWAKHQYLDGGVHYSEWDFGDYQDELVPLQSSDQVVGVALNGVLLFAGTSEYGYDAFFPKAYGNKQSPRAVETDICLGTSQFTNTYRYYMFSPCIYETSLKTVAAPCSSDLYPGCSADVRSHSVAYIPRQLQTITPVGVAKDGRVIYGPYKADGTLWQPCDVDVCNGRMFGNYYGYVATMFHPYFVGCWGPGNSVAVSASCSANARFCNAASGLFYNAIFAVLALAAFIGAF